MVEQKRRSSDRLVEWFRFHGNRATLNEILTSGECFAYEFRARMSEARRRGVAFVLERGATPSQNTYRMVEGKGQMEMAI